MVVSSDSGQDTEVGGEGGFVYLWHLLESIVIFFLDYRHSLYCVKLSCKVSLIFLMSLTIQTYSVLNQFLVHFTRRS